MNPSIPDKELRKIAKEVEKDGWTVETSGGSHLIWRHASGAFITTSKSPSCPFVGRKVRADLKRALKSNNQVVRPRAKK